MCPDPVITGLLQTIVSSIYPLAERSQSLIFDGWLCALRGADSSRFRLISECDI
jgi:hypothetical protein